MKNFSPALLAFLQSNTAYGRADLFSIACAPQQNLLSWSEDLTQWTIFGSSTTVTRNAATDPFGGNSASEVNYGGSDLAGGVRVGQNSLVIPLPSGTPLTASIWLMAPSPVTVELQCGVANVNVNITTTWQRFVITGISTGVQIPLLYISSPVGVNTAFTIFAWGAQLEMAPTVGPYLKTTAAPSGAYGPRPPVILANSYGVDLSYAGNTYFASQNGAWQRGPITSEASFDLRANDMQLTVFAPSSILYPGAAISLMAAAQLGLFDAARVTIYTAYFPTGLSPAAINAFIASVGVENKFAGYIKPAGNITRSKIEFEVADPLYVLDLKMPKHLIQASCRHTLFDVNCTLKPGGSPTLQFVSSPMTVAGGSTRQLLNTTASLGQSPPYYSQGYIVMFSGFNAGRVFHIKKQNSTTQILLTNAMPLPLAIGDTFMAFAGCDKTMATCSSKFSNLINFGGQPFTPNPEAAI